LGSKRDLSFSLCSQEFLAPVGVTLDVLLDDLVSRDIDHVVLDGQVGTSSVNTKSLLMINKDDLWREFGGQISVCSLQR